MIARHDAIVRLRAARWVRDPDTQEIFKVLGGLSDHTRAVGGVVRDTILGRYSIRTDMDLATELMPQEVMDRAREAGMSCYPTGIKHGTVTVRNGQATVEVTTLRQDVRTDGRHAVVQFGKDWTADARRRDFTINALYSSMNGGLHDPLGGLEDLMAGRVRFIGDPDARIAEDYLRVYRFFRFTAGYGGGRCDPQGLEACAKAANKLDQISAERVGAEMMKMLSLQKIAPVMAQMTKSGIMQFSLPVLRALDHYEDLTSSPVAMARLAILFRQKKPEEWQDLWRLSNVTINETSEICNGADLAVAGELHMLAYRHGRVGAVALTVAAAVDDWTVRKYHEAVEIYREIQVPRFPISGDDLKLIGLQQGPKLGKALRRIERDWVKSGFAMDREALLAKLQSYYSLPI